MIYQPEFADAAVLLITSALIDRVRAKYGDRAYRYVHLDAGHVGENVYLTCAALSLGCCATAGFIDNEVNDFIGIDGINETVVYILAIGYDAPNSQEGPYNYA
jgi:SagB-type dehydrogenase family enzyme